jgi:hypothetical protein
MKIAVFRVGGVLGAAWSVAGGIPYTLKRMGHEVFDINVNDRFPHYDELIAFKPDLIIFSGLEWCYETVRSFYDVALRDLAPMAALYHESLHRDDRDWDFEKFKDLANVHFFPAIQDAEKYNGEWLPFGVDVSIFYPRPVEKIYDVGFIGNLYDKRKDFWNQLTLHIPVKKIEAPFSYNDFATTYNLADAYQRCKVFINLPSLSRLLVTKVTEVMACGVPLVTPIPEGGEGNMQSFFPGGQLLYYHTPLTGATMAKYLLDHPDEAEAMAASAVREIRDKHRLDQRLQDVIDRMGFF